MPNNGDLISSGTTQATYYDQLITLLNLLPDNTSNGISPRDVRDTIYSLWERNIIGLQGSTSTKYIGPNPSLRNKYLIGKSTMNGGTETISGSLLTSDYDSFFYNSKLDSLGQNNTKVGFLAGTNSSLFVNAPFIYAEQLSSVINLSVQNNSGDLTLQVPTKKIKLLNNSNGWIVENGAFYPQGNMIIGTSTNRVQSLYISGDINFLNQLSLTGGFTFSNSGSAHIPILECDTFVGVGNSTGYALITNGNGTATFQPFNTGVNTGTIGHLAYYTDTNEVSSLNDMQFTTRVEHTGLEFYFANKLTSTNITIDSTNKLLNFESNSSIVFDNTGNDMGSLFFSRNNTNIFKILGTKISSIDTITITNIIDNKTILSLTSTDISTGSTNLNFSNGQNDSSINKIGNSAGSGKLTVKGGDSLNGKGGYISIIGGNGVSSANVASGNIYIKAGNSNSNIVGSTVFYPGNITLQAGSSIDTNLENSGKIEILPVSSDVTILGTDYTGGSVRLTAGSFTSLGYTGGVISITGGSQSDTKGGDINITPGIAGSDLNNIGIINMLNSYLNVKKTDLTDQQVLMYPSTLSDSILSIQYESIILGDTTTTVDIKNLSNNYLRFVPNSSYLYFGFNSFTDTTNYLGYDSLTYTGLVLTGNTGVQFRTSDGITEQTLAEIGKNGVYLFKTNLETSSNLPKILIDPNTSKLYKDSSGVSDIRLKENIVEMTNVLSSLDQIKSYRYNLKGENNVQLGLIAQEIKDIYPEVIIKHNDFYGINYEKLTPILLGAIKELKVRIERLENGK